MNDIRLTIEIPGKSQVDARYNKDITLKELLAKFDIAEGSFKIRIANKTQGKGILVQKPWNQVALTNNQIVRIVGN